MFPGRFYFNQITKHPLAFPAFLPDHIPWPAESRCAALNSSLQTLEIASQVTDKNFNLVTNFLLLTSIYKKYLVFTSHLP